MSSTQLDATASWTVGGVNQSVSGTFDYTPGNGTVLPGGSRQSLSVSFIPSDTNDYVIAAGSATINVDPAAPLITWPNPADITYGTSLSSTQLDATASWTVGGVNQSVSGTFDYTPEKGTVLPAGSGQSLSVSFTPSDTNDYVIAAGSATINVDPAAPLITWPNPADITYGTALADAQLDASANVAGTFTYTPAVGTVLPAGTSETLSVSFTPDNSADFSAGTATAMINVDKATPTITWPNPSDIYYGTALSGTQLDASASWIVGGVTTTVAGTPTYTPAPGTVLPAGNGQTLSVSFVPTDTTDYTTATATAIINVNKPAPIITWADPADITYGTALSTTQLNATANVAGIFQYTPVPGTYLPAGTDQTLSAVFTPTDTTDFSTVDCAGDDQRRQGDAETRLDRSRRHVRWKSVRGLGDGRRLGRR